MFLHDTTLEQAQHFARFDAEHPLSTSERWPIELEDRRWPSAEHYLQTQLAATRRQAEIIATLPGARQAEEYMSAWYRRKRAGWKGLRRVMMTRALYTKAQMYPEVREFLLATGDELIIETSAYDHYWGIGRDQRGENMLGRVWMDVRAKLRQAPQPG